MQRPHSKVLFYLSFPAGGIGKYTDQLLQRLVGYPDLDIQVACLPEFQWRASPHYRTRPILAPISHRIPSIRRALFLRGQLLNPRRFARLANAERADIVHICNVHHLSFPLWEDALSRSGARWVCSVHDVTRASAILNRRWETRQLQRFYRRCDALIVHSVAQARELQEFAAVVPERIHQVPHGPTQYAPLPHPSRFDELKRRYGLPLGGPVGLLFGFLRPDKNLPDLIEAFALAKPASTLLVAGNGDDRAARERANQYGVDGRIRWQVRYIDDAEIPDLFAVSDWVAVPYTDRFTSQSGVLNLAAAYGRPLLATPTSSFAEFMSDLDLGVLCQGFAPRQIADGITQLERRLARHEHFQFAEYLAQYSWERNAALTRDIYRRLVGGEHDHG